MDNVSNIESNHDQVITALPLRKQPTASTRFQTDSHTEKAAVFPFVDSALRQRLAKHKPINTDDFSGNTALSQTRPAEGAGRDATPEEAYLLDALLDALTNDRFQVYFQTQHCLQTNTVVGAEALLRLTDHNGHLLNTQRLIDVAENTDLIGLVGGQMMSKACNEFAQLRNDGLVQGRLALNVSCLELRHAGYAQALLTAIAQSGLEPQDVELELTESQSLDLTGLKLDQLTTLADLGVDLAVDDFGTGYASWSRIVRLPIRSVKLDRTLVTPLLTCARSQKLIANLAHCGRDMDFRVIAEGVQSAKQQALLLALGCTVGQGFGLSMPQPAEAF